MALSNGPYFEKPAQKNTASGERGKYPDIKSTPTSPSVRLRSSTDEALPIARDGDRQLDGALKAATTAGSGQDTRYLQKAVQGADESEAVSTWLGRSGEQGNAHEQQTYTGDSTTTEHLRKRKRHSVSPPSQDKAGSVNPRTDRWSTAQASMLYGNDEDTSITAQSAAALFRMPSISSKKYTRPPMSKLYTSLELEPEKFLQLQAAAKTYMLDPDHPDRRECVGQRGKGDSELVKMRLWNTVARFLDEEGYGHSHFGSQVLGEQGLKRSMVWPLDKSRIIGTVMPLLRRMVTNERQRQYAAETRKGDFSSTTRSLEKSNTERASPENPGHLLQDGPVKPADNTQISDTSQPGATSHDYDTVQLRFNVIRNNQRISSPYDSTARECPDLQTVFLKALPYLSGRSRDDMQISALMPSGLTVIQDDDGWIKALNQVNQLEWMDNEMKVLIES